MEENFYRTPQRKGALNEVRLRWVLSPQQIYTNIIYV
jgi:hypothetical protein